MNFEEINQKFWQVIHKKQRPPLYEVLDSVTENKLYNWRNSRTTPTFGEMLEILYNLGEITIHGPNKQPSPNK